MSLATGQFLQIGICFQIYWNFIPIIWIEFYLHIYDWQLDIRLHDWQLDL